MEDNNKKIFFEFIILGFLIVLLGSVFGALYEIDWKIETKIIFGGFFIMLIIIANELSKISKISDTLSEFHIKTYMQLILIGKKQGVKENVEEVWEELLEKEKKKLKFERLLTGDITSKIYFGCIIGILVVAVVTVYAIKTLN